MMIRRIAESLRTRSFLMFATELTIVIVGVFLGIQVSNWNDARIEETRAYSYLERIRNDLDSDIKNYRAKLEFWDEVTAYGLQALTYANTGNPEGQTEWDLLFAYFQASQMGAFLTTRNTFDELKSGGELGLIRDLKLRNRLASYYRDADNPVLSERPAYREHIRGLIPIHIQNYIWKHCYSIQGDLQLINQCKAPITQNDAANLTETFRNDTLLTAELRYWMSTLQIASLMGNYRINDAEQMRDLVNENIESGSSSNSP